MAAKPSPTYDDEIKIDFGKYIETLVRQWQWIAACALGLGILALAYSFFINFNLNPAPPTYEAVALVASVKTESNVNFGTAITTTSEAALAGAQLLYDSKARLQSFVALVQNGAVAQQVLAEVGPRLKENERTPTALLRMVSASLIPSTDTIQISVTYGDPVIAAEIANAWGKAYVYQINEVYGGTPSGTSLVTTEAQTTQAKTDYDKAQAALDDFIAHDKRDEYSRQIGEISAINTSLSGARSTVGNQRVQDHLARLGQAYSDSRQIGLFLDNAVSMRAAVNTGGEPAAISNALALTMLKTQIYAAFPGTNTLQVQNLPEALGSTISTVNATGMVADLDALIATLKTRQTELNTLIDPLSSEVQNEDYLMNFSNANTPIEMKILENEQKIRDLNSLISTETSTLNELTRARDLAWQTYSTLATKSAEISVAAQTTGMVVAFASPANPPDAKVSQVSLSLPNAGLATGVGLLIGIVVAYAYEFWQNYKGRQPEIISKKMFAYAKNLVYKSPIKFRKKLK
jgi:uncharacterized protein involved in exopolysaccharide biosynthesis